MEYVCELCHPDAIEIGQVVPGLWLASEKDKYHLMGMDGHGGRIFHTFAKTPEPEPIAVDEDNMSEIEFQEWIKWEENIGEGEHEFKVDPYEGYEFVTDCIEHAGYIRKEHGNFFRWLWDFCGKLILAHQKKV